MLDTAPIDTAPFRQAVDAWKVVKEVPGVLSASSFGVHCSQRILESLAEPKEWQLKEFPSEAYPFEATVVVDGVAFYSLLSLQTTLDLGICPIPPGEPELPEPTLEELVLI